MNFNCIDIYVKTYISKMKYSVRKRHHNTTNISTIMSIQFWTEFSIVADWNIKCAAHSTIIHWFLCDFVGFNSLIQFSLAVLSLFLSYSRFCHFNLKLYHLISLRSLFSYNWTWKKSESVLSRRSEAVNFTVIKTLMPFELNELIATGTISLWIEHCFLLCLFVKRIYLTVRYILSTWHRLDDINFINFPKIIWNCCIICLIISVYGYYNVWAVSMVINVSHSDLFEWVSS